MSPFEVPIILAGIAGHLLLVLTLVFYVRDCKVQLIPSRVDVLIGVYKTVEEVIQDHTVPIHTI